MNNDLIIAVECIPFSMFQVIETNSDLLWFHLESNQNIDKVLEIISNFTYLPNLSHVMTSGYMSEILHDRFDEILEEKSDPDSLVMTVWSEDSFSETLWEFLNVHGTHPSVKFGKALIVADSTSAQMKLISEFSSSILAE